MKTIIKILLVFFILSSSLTAKLTEPMLFLRGPEDAHIFSYDYNPVCGVSAALVVSEYDATKNWIPTRTALLIKKDGDSVWSLGMEDVRSDALVRVFDNGLIKLRSRFQDLYGYDMVEHNWVAYTTDFGLNWTKSDVTWQSQELYSRGSNIFKLRNDYVYLSYDYGKEWYNNKLPNDFREYQHVIYYDFISVSDSGVAYVQSRHDYYNIHHPDTVYFLKSKDQIHWENVGMNMREKLKEMLFRDESRIFALTDSTGILYSSDQGKTFERIALTDKKLLFMKFTDENRNEIFAANQSEAFLINTDNFNVTKLSVPGGVISGIGTKNKQLYLCNYTAGIFTSEDSGKSWNIIDKPTRPLAYFMLKIDKNDVIYVLSQGFYPNSSYRLYKSSDYGSNWEFILESDKNLWIGKMHGKVFLNYSKEMKLYVFDTEMKLSFDYSGYGYYNLFMPYDDNSLLLDFNVAGGLHDYFKSSDAGTNWVKIDKPETNIVTDSYYIKENGERYSTDIIKFYFWDKNINLKNQYSPDFLVITERSGDPRIGFTYYDRPSKAFMFKDKQDDVILFEGDITDIEKNANIHVSTDDGLSWEKSNFNVSTYVQGNAFLQNKDDDIFYIYESGLYIFNSDSNRLDKTANFPANTISYDTSVSRDTYLNIKMDYDSKGSIIGTLKYSGLFYYPADGNNSNIPDLSEPISVYPNPINNETVVKFHVERDKSIVTIKVYDYLGKEALDAYLDILKAGDYKQKINLGCLPGGIYLIVVNISGTVRAAAVQVWH